MAQTFVCFGRTPLDLYGVAPLVSLHDVDRLPISHTDPLKRLARGHQLPRQCVLYTVVQCTYSTRARATV